MRRTVLSFILGIIILGACVTDYSREASTIFLCADSLLNTQPDSALRMLQTFAKQRKLTRKESATMALVMARAYDKSQQSLLPCDSLLDLSLRYYKPNEYQRAVALLYKGRLEVEMNRSEEAIAHLLDAKEILAKYPEEQATWRNVLSSLGTEYFASNLYGEAQSCYRELLNYCHADKDKAIALTNMSRYYSVQEMKDSSIITQRQALHHALASHDEELVSLCQYNLSLAYHEFEEPDSALHYIDLAIGSNVSQPSGLYYVHKGEILLAREGSHPDSIAYYLDKSLEDSLFTAKAVTLYNLYLLKKGEKKHIEAMDYLDRCLFELDSLYSSEKSTEILQLIYSYDNRIKIREEQEKADKRFWSIVSLSVILCFIIILVYQWLLYRKKRQEALHRQALEKTRARVKELQTTIRNNQTIISLLQEQHSHIEKEQENNLQLINEREQLIEQLQQEKQKLLNWLFGQSSICKRVESLEKQLDKEPKEQKALNHAEQDKLRKTIQGIYADYITELHTAYPRLTEDDCIYLSLQRTSLSARAIAICFGYTSTHPINQRKLRIKERMNIPKTQV